MSVLLVGLIFGLFFAFVCKSIAKGKNRDGVLWFIGGLFFGPFALAVALLPKLDAPGGTVTDKPVIQSQSSGAVADEPDISIDDETKQCPSCAETIKFKAIKCRYCGHQFDESQVAAQVAQRQAERQTELEMLKKGLKRCPTCNHIDAYKDASGNYYCPHCEVRKSFDLLR